MANVFESVQVNTGELFRQSMGFVIPEYQRPYRWSVVNITQLIVDICSEANRYILVSDSPGEDLARRFLGSLILMKTDLETEGEGFGDATPNQVQIIVDGQQRITTIVMLLLSACSVLDSLLEESDIEEARPLRSLISSKREEIIKLITIKTVSQVDELQPKLIRAGTDKWLIDSTADEQSNIYRAVSEFLFQSEENSLDALKRWTKVVNGVNDRRFGELLDFTRSALMMIASCHLDGATNPELNGAEVLFPSASSIAGLGNRLSRVWGQPNPQVSKLAVRIESIDDHTLHRQIAKTVQVVYFIHFVLERCHMVSVFAPDIDRALDMFQSLNTAGTPLTTIETFRPVAMKTITENSRPLVRRAFERIEKQFEDLGKKNSEKISSAATSLVNRFAYVHTGIPPETKSFSDQRRWLETEFRRDQDNRAQLDFILKLQRVSDFQLEVQKALKDNQSFEKLDQVVSSRNRELAKFCTVFLQEAQAELALTVLARSYLDHCQTTSRPDVYCEVAKSVSAFHTLWRCASGTSKLDDAYRSALPGRGKELQIDVLRSTLTQRLRDQDLADHDKWIQKARSNLRYGGLNAICRFVLLVTSHNRMPTREDGFFGELQREEAEESLSTKILKSKKHKSIEHIAPQKRPENSSWESGIYEGELPLVDSIGNLTLLPTPLNSSAGNKGWTSKWIYYKQVGDKQLMPRDAFNLLAEEHDIVVEDKLYKVLSDAQYIHLNAPLALQAPASISWTGEMIKERRNRILELTWTIMWDWLGNG